MSNQESKFTTIDISYSFIGGDKFQQGLQEYVTNLQYNKNTFPETENTSLELKEVNIMGEILSTNSTN